MNLHAVFRDARGGEGAPLEKNWGKFIVGVLPPGPPKKKVWDVAAP
jgi:hypothetical protein